MNFKPKNRHILIQVEEKEQEEISVLLPEGYSRREEYISAFIKDISLDCNLDVRVGDKVIVPSNVVLQVDNNISLVQENYILGVFSE